MGNIRYKSGEISKMLGVTPETIRYYEKHGIVLSSKDQQNGYREFHFFELISMQRLRLYNNFGFQLKDSFDLINNKSVDQLNAILQKNEKKLKKTIQWNQRLLEYSEELITVTSQIPEMLYHYRIEDSPAVYHLKYQNDRQVIKNKELEKLLKHWYAQCPLVLASCVAPLNDMKPWYQAEIGFSIYEKDYERFIHESSDLVSYYPSRPSLYTIYEVDHNVEDFYQPGKPAFDYIKENNIDVDNHLLSIPIAMNCKLTEDSQPKDYYQLWIPLK